LRAILAVIRTRDDLDSTRISYQQAYNGFYTVVFGLNIRVHIVLSMIIFLLIKKMKLNYGVYNNYCMYLNLFLKDKHARNTLHKRLRLHDPSRSAYTKYMELFFSEFFYKINFEAMVDFWLVSRHLNGGR
jgi:hypothetical protein